MTTGEPQFLDVGHGERARRIAYRQTPPRKPGAPGIVWLIGLKSDMESSKATALAQWCEARGIGITRFDYSGHGRSGGRFEEATVGDWIEEAEAVVRRLTEGAQILVGSSTGAHVALMLLKRLVETEPKVADRVRALVLVAPAWNVTELMWNELPAEARASIMSKGVWMRPSPYDPVGYPITRRFIEDGRKHLLAGQKFDPGRAIEVLQGLKDKDVPPAHARALKDVLAGDWVRLTEVADGDHRLAREQDLELLFDLIERHLTD